MAAVDRELNRERDVKYLHTMVRVSNIDEALDFYCDGLGLQEIRRYESEQGRFTNVFLAAPDDHDAQGCGDRFTFHTNG